MNLQASATRPEKAHKLKLLCAPEGEAYRLYIWPTWLPDSVAKCLDSYGEAYPVYLDLEELDRQMKASRVEYTKSETIDRGIHIDAEGPAAVVLTLWLANMLQSCTRGIVE